MNEQPAMIEDLPVSQLYREIIIELIINGGLFNAPPLNLSEPARALLDHVILHSDFEMDTDAH